MTDLASEAGVPPRHSHTDILSGDWIDRQVPRFLRPYARLARWDRPIGWWLLLLPCWWGVALAGQGLASGPLLILFLVGAVAMRGAGCTLNDIVDRKIDAAVERTRDRPVASGAVSVPMAALFLLGQMAIGGFVLLSLPRLAIYLALAILVIVAAYPFMKRITYWPQLFLGLNFNWGALVAWAAVRGEITAAPVLLYLAGIAWTLGYDTIYAHQDIADDLKIGVKSTAIRFGRHSRAWVGGFFLTTLAGIAAAFVLARVHPGAWIAFAGLAGHFFWQVASWRIEDPADCLAKFKSNKTAGLIAFAACLLAGWP